MLSEWRIAKFAMISGIAGFLGISWFGFISAVTHAIFPVCALSFPIVITGTLTIAFYLDWDQLKQSIMEDIKNPYPLTEQDLYTD